MRRRAFLLASISAFVIPFSARAKTAISITGLWTEGPTGSTIVGQQRGVLHFTSNVSQRTLVSYVNDHPVDGSAGKHECVELIKRYAASLGFPTFQSSKIKPNGDGNGLPSLGNGVDAASEFARASDSSFIYYGNGESNDLPKTGSVLSTNAWTESVIDPKTKRFMTISVPGHVGIICNYGSITSKTSSVKVKLFDQNMDKSSIYKDVTFTKSASGKWRGEITINGVTLDVKGWASPVASAPAIILK